MLNIVTAFPMGIYVDSIANAYNAWINFLGKIYKIITKMKDANVRSLDAKKTTVSVFGRDSYVGRSAIAKIARIHLTLMCEKIAEKNSKKWKRCYWELFNKCPIVITWFDRLKRDRVRKNKKNEYNYNIAVKQYWGKI